MAHQFNRRNFIRTALGVGGVMAAPSLLAKTMSGTGCNREGGRPYGIQMYMVRDMLASDPVGTIKKLGKAGFKHLELFGVGGTLSDAGAPLFGLSIDEMASLIRDNGMSVPTVHVNSELEDMDKIAELGEKLGIEYFIEPMAGEFLNFNDGKVNLHIPKAEDEVKAIAERLNTRGENMKSIGYKFAYHNHNFEFNKISDKYIFDIMVEHTDEDLVKLELDLGWVAASKVDPVTALNKYKTRVIGCHMKDYDGSLPLAKDNPKMVIPEMSQISTPGEGKTDFKAITQFLNANNVKYRYVEVDVTPTPFEDAVRGLCYLSSLG